MTDSLHIGVVDHLGWAVVVAVAGDATVVDRRRIELLDQELPNAPVHHLGGPHVLHRTGNPISDDELAALVATVRASAELVIGQELDRLVGDLPRPVATLSLRQWPDDFPTDIASQRRVPFEARADPVMYRIALAAAGRERQWTVSTFDPRLVEAQAIAALGHHDDEVLRRPRATLGAPWTKDHRMALAAGIVASRAG